MKKRIAIFCSLVIAITIANYHFIGITQTRDSANNENNCSTTYKTEVNIRSENKPEIPSSIPFEIVSPKCFSKNTLCIIYLDPKYFNKDEIRTLTLQISKKARALKSNFLISIYDDKELAIALLQGKREPQSVQNDRRAWYFKSKNSEYLMFLPNKNDKLKLDIVRIK